MQVSLDGLEALEAIAEAGSFAKAGARLRKATSAVSYAVARLEESLGAPLFDRSGHRARLTDAGRRALDEGRAILARARRLERLAEELRTGWEPSLAVVVDGALPLGPVLDALAALHQAAVPTNVALAVEYRRGVQARFERERADLMLVKDLAPSEALVARPLPEVELVLVAARSHPLGRRAGRLGPRALQEHVELTVQGSSATDGPLFGGPRVHHLPDFPTKRDAVARGLGYGFLPRHLADDALRTGALVRLRVPGLGRQSFTPWLVHAADRPPGRAGALFAGRLLAPRRR